MLNISPIARQFAPWSISKLDQAKSCPKQFDFQHIQKLKALVKTSDSNVGTAAHSVIEFLLLDKNWDEAVRLALGKTPLVANEQDALLMLRTPIEAFVSRFSAFKVNECVKYLLLEQKWAITDTGEATDFFGPNVFFRGVVDLAAITEADDIWIIDHKSGKVFDLKYKINQLNAYVVLALANYPKLAGARTGINALGNLPSKQLQFTKYVDNNQIRNSLLPWLFEHINECAENLATLVARPKLPWPCKWCAYSPSCPDYQGLMNGSDQD